MQDEQVIHFEEIHTIVSHRPHVLSKKIIEKQILSIELIFSTYRIQQYVSLLNLLGDIWHNDQSDVLGIVVDYVENVLNAFGIISFVINKWKELS